MGQMWIYEHRKTPRRDAPAAAQAFREAADELAEALNGAEETVSLKEAAMLGGYSIDALQRMVACGRIQNVGRKGKPRNLPHGRSGLRAPSLRPAIHSPLQRLRGKGSSCFYHGNA